MLGNFSRRSTDRKQRVIDSPASSGGQGKYMKYVSFPLTPPVQQGQFLILFFVVKNNILRRN